MEKNPLFDPLLQPGSYINPIIADSDDPSDVSNQIPSSRHHANVVVDGAPDWLPPGWRVKSKVRTSGVAAGQTDKYYYDPGSKHWFRSKKEVLSFLKSGVIGSGKKKLDGPDAETTSEGSKRKKTAPKAKIEDFNFNDVPTKVKWVMTDIYNVSWKPLVDGIQIVPNDTKQQWAAAYKHLSLRKNRLNA